jgi:SAM-dependent methyltransferase
MPNQRYQDVNAATIDRWVAEGWEWGRPVDHQTYRRAAEGDWSLLLTPTKPVPRSWYPPLEGAQVLGLASGGGQQMPILTAAGARCTVLDYSPAQLEAERQVAAREGYDINIVRADMTEPLPFADASFDLVINPVSLCYVREVEPIWREVARVLRPGGVLLAGLDTGLNYVVDEAEQRIVRGLPFDPLANPALMAELEAEDDGVQFSHTLDELLGGLLRAGFAIDDLFEDVNGEGRLSELGIPTMLAVRAHLR